MRHIGLPTLWLFLVGAVPGSVLDALYVFREIESYPMPIISGLAWWVPLLLGGTVVAIGWSHPLLDPMIGNRRQPRGLISSISASTWLILAYLITASVLGSIGKLGLILIIYLDVWLLTGRGWQNLVLSLVTAITGTLIAMILVAAGAFSYLHPDMLGIPYWLPCMYALTSVIVGDLGRALVSSLRG